MTLSPSYAIPNNNILEERVIETGQAFPIPLKGMTMNLGRGFIDVIIGSETLKIWFTDMILPSQRYSYSPGHLLALPPISSTYETLKNNGLSPEQIIEKLIEIYLPFKLFRVREFAEMPLIIGLIGQRGSGKTCGAVAIITLDWLVRGLPVWSNVPITVRVVYKDAEKIFKSIPLEQLEMLNQFEGYRSGVALVDEANMTAAEATRYSSGANLDFGYTIQQIRKRMMSVIWTCQGFAWVDNRLRWQTDFLIACRDAYLENKCKASCIGDKSIWLVHDLSGMTNKFDYDYQTRHKYVTDYKVGDPIWWWNRPWWYAYNTYEIQNQSYIESYKAKKAEARREERTNQAVGIVKAFLDDNIEEMDCLEFWKRYKVSELSLKRLVKSLLDDEGFIKKRDHNTKQYYFTRLDE